MTGRCSPKASWLTLVPARQENTGGRTSEQDDDAVMDLTDAQWWCSVVPVVGETGPASGSFSEVGGCSGTCTRGWKAGEVARHRQSGRNRGEARQGRLTGGRQWWGRKQNEREGPLL
jgi:hypothetical protein